MPFFIPSTDPVRNSPPATPLARFCEQVESRFGWVTRCVVWAVLFQLVCLVYLPSLSGPFIYDDIEAIAGNPDLRAPLEPWRAFRDHEISLHFDKRPVAGLVTLIDFQLWGLHARGYRMTNLFLHFTCGLAIAALASAVARRLGSGFPILFGHLLAMIWLLHPLATSTVSFIFQRFHNYIKAVGEMGGHAWEMPGHVLESKGAWGYGGVCSSLDEWKSRYEFSIRFLKEARDKGLSAAVYTQTTDVFTELNGLMTFDRVPKADAEWLRQINSMVMQPEPSASVQPEAAPGK